jgi:hypothetical protein
VPAASCETCGAGPPEDARFCPACGAPLGATVESETEPRYFGVLRGPGIFGDLWRALRDTTGYAVESVSVHAGARRDLFRLRRELAELLAQRAESARILGESVYAGDEEGTETARTRLAELDGLVRAKEEEMEQKAAAAIERIQRAQLEVQPTLIEPPAPAPEPFPEPSPPPQPVPVPEPMPEPSEPPGPVRVPEPSPVPSPPPQPE